MRRHVLSRIVAFIIGLALIAAVILGMRILSQKMHTPTAANTQTDNREDAAETMETVTRGAYQLRAITTLISGRSYTSFEVYWQHEGDSELWYTCGRMFPSEEVASIGWANDDYDIEVRLKDGNSVLFSYNGNNEWI